MKGLCEFFFALEEIILVRKFATIKIFTNFAPKETREIMATTLKKSNGMTPMQLHLVSMLNFNSTEAAEQRLKTALEQFYLSEFEKMKEEMRTSGALTEDIIAEGAAKHFRTSY